MAVRKTSDSDSVDDWLDTMLEESFPASDPPSFTPVARVGKPPEDEIDDYPGDEPHSPRLLCMALGALALGMATLAVFMAVRGRPGRRSRHAHRFNPPKAAGTLLQPLIEAAQTGREAATRVREGAMRRAA